SDPHGASRYHKAGRRDGGEEEGEEERTSMRARLFAHAFVCSWLISAVAQAQAPASITQTRQPLNIIAFGAHPDDCDSRAGGVAVREQVIRQMRHWKADLVLAPRPNEYHPDHRYTGILVQDAAYMVTVPNVAPDTPALRKNPTFMYFQDGFQKPAPFAPDVAISIDDVFDKKIDMLDAHVSQVY